MLNKASKFLQVNMLDFVKGLITAVFGAAMGIIFPVIQSGSFDIHWGTVIKAALAAALAYLGKNLFTNSEGQFMKKEPK